MRSERNQSKLKRGHVAGAVPIARAGFRSERRAKANYWSWGSRGDDRYRHQIRHLTRAPEGGRASDPTTDGRERRERRERTRASEFGAFGTINSVSRLAGIG